jgi:hypothetical protein
LSVKVRAQARGDLGAVYVLYVNAEIVLQDSNVKTAEVKQFFNLGIGQEFLEVGGR